MNDQVRLIALGTGNSFTEGLWYSNFVFIHGERYLFVDCPPYLPKMLREHRDRLGDPRLSVSNYREVIPTHNHEDHVAGVEEVGYFAIRQPPERRPILYGTRENLAKLWEGSLRAGLELRVDAQGRPLPLTFADYFKTVELGPLNDLGGGLRLETRLNTHQPPTIALKFIVGEHRLGYSSDTGFDPGLIEWLSDCRFVIHEVHFNPDVAFHTDIRRLRELPADLQRRIHLIHYGDDFRQHDPSPMRFLEQGRVYFPFA